MQTMGELLERNERYYPDVDAYVVDQQRLRWGEVVPRMRRLASALEERGLKRQDRVGVLCANGMEYVELYGACEWAGFILAAYNYRLAAPEIAWLLEDTAPTILFFESGYAELIDGLRSSFPAVRQYICIGDPTPAWASRYEQVLNTGDAGGTSFRSRSDDWVYLFYTSGTTGRPKGVPVSHDGALFTSQFQGRQCGADLRILQATPLFHVGGSGFICAAKWMAGTTVITRAFDPLRFLELVQKEKITFAFLVAPMIQAVLDHPRFEEFDISSLRSVMSASAPIAVPLLRRAIKKMGPVFFVSYGSTEAGPICALERHELNPEGDERQVGRLASVGHFVPEVDAAILDDNQQPCPTNTVGEVCVRTRIFKCYWNNSIATIEATRSGRLHTGDLGYSDEEGYVFLVDRKKDMIISGGENIYSREVEEALHRHPAVLESAVIGVPDEKWGEAVRAVVVLRAGQEASAAVLIAYAQTQIARYKCPKAVEIVNELPRVTSGKIDKVALRKQYGGDSKAGIKS